MKKVGLLFTLMMFAVVSFGQVLTAPTWMPSDSEEYADMSYEKATTTVYKAPQDWSGISDVASFDATWDLLPEENMIANPTGDWATGDEFNLDAEETLGSSWKAVHDGDYVYLLLKYVDTDGYFNAGSYGWEIAYQANPDASERWEPTYDAGTTIKERNYAYVRYAELGGFKVTIGESEFNPGQVEHKGSYGMYGQTASPEWSNVQEVKDMFIDLEPNTFWDESNGITRAVLVMDFDNVLTYPDDPMADDIWNTSRSSTQVGETIAFEVKSFAATTETYMNDDDEEVTGPVNHDFWWSGNTNDTYFNLLYNGLLTISGDNVPTNVSDVNSSDNGEISYADGVVYVEGQAADLEVFNLTGANVLSAENVSSLSLSSLSKGVYIVRVNGQNSVKVVKR